MKIKIYKTFFILIISSVIQAQMLEPKWEQVFESQERTVYIDTSSVKQYDNQISVLSLTVFKKPQMIATLNEEAESMKSQLLFNTASKKYTVIGSLYYDKNSKILGQTSLPGFASGNDKFAIPIEGNDEMTAVYNKSLSYTKKESYVIEQNPSQLKSEKSADAGKNDEQKNKIVNQPIKNKPKETQKANDRIELYLSKKDSMQKAEILKQANLNQSENKARENETLKSGKSPSSKISKSEFDAGKEKNPKGMIFNDGSKYCFQVSSWKLKSQAELEVQKLKRKGHGAFITEGSVRGRIWYRVRIGYFDSIGETEAYMKKLR